MRGKLLLIYSILFLFVIFGYLFIYKLNKYNESIKVRDYKEIIDDRVLRVAVIKDSIYSDLFRSDNEKVYDFFKSINVEDSLIIEIYSFGTKTEALSELNNKKIDIVAINIPVTSDYNDLFMFSETIETDRLVLVQRSSKKNPDFIESVISLEDKCIDISDNPSVVLRLNNLKNELGKSINVVEHIDLTNSRLIEMVSDSIIDYTVCNKKLASKLQAKYSNIDLSLYVGFTQKMAWAVRQESPILCDSLNNWLDMNQICLFK